MRCILPAGFLAVVAALPLAAQTTNAPAAGGHASLQERVIGFLPQADQDRVVAAYNKALAENPKLKAEKKELEKGWTQIADANSMDRIAFMEKRRSHDQKLREAMLKADPTLGPILAEIDQHFSAQRAAEQKAASGANATP